MQHTPYISIPITLWLLCSLASIAMNNPDASPQADLIRHIDYVNSQRLDGTWSGKKYIKTMTALRDAKRKLPINEDVLKKTNSADTLQYLTHYGSPDEIQVLLSMGVPPSTQAIITLLKAGVDITTVSDYVNKNHKAVLREAIEMYKKDPAFDNALLIPDLNNLALDYHVGTQGNP